MRVLVFVNHPAHVHLFKNMVWNLQGHGHTVKILAREKELVFYLLNKYGFKYTPMGKFHRSIPGKAYEIIATDYTCYRQAKKFSPDILVDVGIYGSHTSRLLKRPSIIFNDTEHSKLTNLMYVPFATAICTPSCFKKDLGKKQIRYNGYHELAYLHPNYFKPDPSVLEEIGLDEKDKYIIVRFVIWGASHDFGQHGFDLAMKRKLVAEMEKHGKVLITSEGPLPKEFEKHQIKVPPEKIHDLLYYAALYIGDGGTMATEAAILGTPSIHVSTMAQYCGNFSDLAEKYGLIHTYSDQQQALQKAIELIYNKNPKEEWRYRREKLLRDKIDVTRFMVDFIENYWSEPLRLDTIG